LTFYDLVAKILSKHNNGFLSREFFVWKGGKFVKKRIAVISAVLEEPEKVQFDFNKIVSDYKDIVRGRIGLPFHDEGISVISIIVVGALDEINSLTGKLGNLNSCIVKTSISKKEID
jgi:putative iron-only hydrogenase system regulator